MSFFDLLDKNPYGHSDDDTEGCLGCAWTAGLYAKEAYEKEEAQKDAAAAADTIEKSRERERHETGYEMPVYRSRDFDKADAFADGGCDCFPDSDVEDEDEDDGNVNLLDDYLDAVEAYVSLVEADASTTTLNLSQDVIAVAALRYLDPEAS